MSQTAGDVLRVICYHFECDHTELFHPGAAVPVEPVPGCVVCALLFGRYEYLGGTDDGKENPEGAGHAVAVPAVAGSR